MSDKPRDTDAQEQSITIPDIDKLPERPILQTLASPKSWVRVVFYSEELVTRAMIDRAIENLVLIRNGWDV